MLIQMGLAWAAAVFHSMGILRSGYENFSTGNKQ